MHKQVIISLEMLQDIAWCKLFTLTMVTLPWVYQRCAWGQYRKLPLHSAA